MMEYEINCQKVKKQERIPVASLPSAAVAMCIPACTDHCVSEHALGRGCITACTEQEGMHWEGGCLARGVGVCTEADTDPVNRMTDRQM